ncbi:sodium/hydrogen exchanger 9B2-like [Oppia nitens]|uniref:sodium/hydrogen exchanger 9B2-like n=1 Tax=Oppia nitens TaxID=1686743 RepID=UPI0023DB36BE|nr:sodium/hydrogen exchanger 9B2-like [Oppia nitens]
MSKEMSSVSHSFLKNFTKENVNQFFSSDNITQLLSQALIVAFIWATLWSIEGPNACPPDGHLFHLLVVYICCHIASELMILFCLPPVVGILVTGCLLANIFTLNLNKQLATILRDISLVVILLRVGLELSPNNIFKLYDVCLRLSLIPCIVETIIVSIISCFLLDLPFKWSLLLGFLLSASSPAIIVSNVLPLKNKGFGESKSISSMLMASSCVDNIVTISGVMMSLRIIFNSEMPLVLILLTTPLEIIIGLFSGILFGLILWFIPSNTWQLIAKIQRFVLLLMSAITSKFVSKSLDISSAGPLACVVIAFTAAINWRDSQINETLVKQMDIIWSIFRTLLFALIGTSIKISNINFNNTFYGLICLIIALFVRSVTVIAIIFGANLNFKEKLFISFTWLSKATVQASLGPMALDFINSDDNYINDRKYAEKVLDLAVLAIIVTAPLSSLLISLTGPLLLTTNKSQKSEKTQTNKN